MRVSRLPQQEVRPDAIALGRGLDLISPEISPRGGALRIGYNVECDLNGGMRRIGGIERYDGQAEPNLANYTLLQLEAAPTGVALGDTLNGATSGATGKVIYLNDKLVGLTRTTGTFQVEILRKVVTAVGSITTTTPEVDGALDNRLSALAAAEYRTSIGQVPGSGPVRGLEMLGSTLYAWRDNAGGTALAIYKATSTGWQAVSLLWEVSFTAGSAAYAEGSTLSRGGVTATVKRVALESGAWSGTAAGRMIITAPVGGNFTAGAATGGGACTLSGAATQISLLPGGSVRTDVSNFTASLATQRIYGCDGVNREFELADDILVPLTTGMGAVRATCVREHKKHLFFGFRGSMQHSSITLPYQYAPISGAAELGTADVLTDMIPVGGSEVAAALMVLCQDSVFALYGNSSADWKLNRLSRVSGGARATACDVGGVMALDKLGIVLYQPTQSYGNFAWASASRRISAIVAGQDASFALFIPTAARYRLFLADGTGVSGLVMPNAEAEWTTFNYGRRMVCGVSREMAGVQRTFTGDDQGWVYELDVGRSFAGDAIDAIAGPVPMNQRAPTTIKQYRNGMLEVESDSACTLYVGAEFAELDDDVTPQDPVTLQQPGRGLVWDVSNWDTAYWDVPLRGKRAITVEGQGASVAVSVASSSAEELPYTLRALIINYSPLRAMRF